MAVSRQEVWQGATVVGAQQLTSEIRRIEFDVDSPVRVDPGAHVDVRLPIRGVVEKRSYSIVEASPDGSRIALSVYRSPVTRGGADAMGALAAGDRVELTQPLNDFSLRLGAAKYVLVAGGVGITALLGMAAALRSAGADYRLVYAGRSRSLMAYVDRLAAEHGERLAIHARDEGTSVSVPDLVAGVEPGTEVYVCGPIRLMDAMRRQWTERGLPPGNLRAETFGNSGWFDAQPFTVRVEPTGLEVVVAPDQTMLEALESAGADMLSDCRKGECGLCEVRVAGLEGVIDHRDVFYSERQKDASGRMCCCVSRVVPASGGRAVVSIIPT